MWQKRKLFSEGEECIEEHDLAEEKEDNAQKKSKKALKERRNNNKRNKIRKTEREKALK